MRFFINKCTYLLTTSEFWPQVLQMSALQQLYFPFKPQNPNIRGAKNKFTSTKIQILPWKYFPEWFGHKTIKPIGFPKYFMKNQLKLFFQRYVSFDLERAQTSEHCYKDLEYSIKNSFASHWHQKNHFYIVFPELHHKFPHLGDQATLVGIRKYHHCVSHPGKFWNKWREVRWKY